MVTLPEYLTIPEAAGLLRCSRAHVYNLLNGRVLGVPMLPSVNLGRRKVIRRETLIRWMELNESKIGEKC
jgi:excisionase family DNA binding protein